MNKNGMLKWIAAPVVAVCVWNGSVLRAQEAEAEDEIKAPPPPKKFAFTLNNGYGEGDKFPTDPAVFENLLINMKKAGFNAIYCVYKDWRLPLCEKHGVKMMIDVLAWHEGALTDIRRNEEQRATIKAICEKVRGNDAVWGYNIWNEKMSCSETRTAGASTSTLPCSRSGTRPTRSGWARTS